MGIFSRKTQVVPEPQVRKWAKDDLPCHGCAHGAARAGYPGFPSGEFPCMDCVRNPEIGLSKVKGDHYITLDRLEAWRNELDSVNESLKELQVLVDSMKVESEGICAQCEERDKAPGDYLCRECRYGE